MWELDERNSPAARVYSGGYLVDYVPDRGLWHRAGAPGTGMGGIQNLGVAPLYRGRGLGSALLLQALQGFRRAGLGRAFLEVTAQNEGAVRLYRRMGFRCRKTVYKAVETSTTFELVGESKR